MQFTYAHGIPTVEQAVRQGIEQFIQSGQVLSQPVVQEAIRQIADDVLSEVRMIFTSEMSSLLDPEGVAADFNDGVEKCIQLVEGSL